MIIKNKKGFTLVELLAVIVVLAIILAVAIPTISGIITSSTKGAMASDAKMVLQGIKYKLLEDDTFDPTTITEDNITTNLKLSANNYSDLVITKVGNDYKIVIIGQNRWDGYTAYGTMKTMQVVASEDYDVTLPVITLLGDSSITIELGSTYDDAGATAMDNKDGDITEDIVVTGTVDANTIGTYTLTYNVSDSNGNAANPVSRTVSVVKIGNAPVLATGMTPIKWSESELVETTEDDTEWYNYTISDKQWANAKTADGSMWVWIPRYIYKISSGWHTNSTGTIDVQWSIGTDDTRGGTVTLDSGTGADASNNKWTNHPAFTFGTTELTGIWVAKFEASGLTSAVDIKSDVASLRNLTIGSMFTATRNMETNDRYGWGTSGTGIDTHLIKNIEWGAVAYLAQSTYGKNAEVWINNSSTYITGCAGSSVSAAAYDGCENTYNTSNGQQASTTGNVYGVYDMSGGAFELTAAYADNGNSNLVGYGSSLISADNKYKDIYPVTTDEPQTIYANAINLKGDAIYETSSSYSSNNAWYGSYSVAVGTICPWFLRGGVYSYTTKAETFTFNNTTGSAAANGGFRPVLLVESGL